MQVRINDTNTIRIKWTHQKLKGDDLSSHRTLCLVEVLPPLDGSSADFQRIQTEAKCSKKDIFSLDTGKKVSLSRALLKIIPGMSRKTIRQQIWNEYLGIVEESE